jgi:3-(3-hydroxy-phenyl)propionate hydroxylase
MVPTSTDPGKRPVVAVVGRGPVGMTLALRLAGFQIPTVLIDTQGERISPGSKAVVMQQHAVEVLSTVGIAEQMLQEGVAWTVSRAYRRSRQLFEARLEVEGGELPRVLNLPQARTEELLLRQVQVTPLITTRLHRTLVGLKQDDTTCRLLLDGPEGTEQITADYVAGCDGARSATRKLLGIPFRGNAHDDVYLINDIVASLPFPDERRFYFDPPFNPGRTVLIHPQGPDQWHIDYQIGRVASDQETPEEDESARRLRIGSVIGTTNFTVAWSTSYRFKHLVADRFQVGRAFLVGDAAHLVSPYGARGLNSGLADADNLAWRLAAVINQSADPVVLEGYQVERRPVALDNMRITSATARFMSPLTRRQRWWRDAILAAATRFDAAKRFVNNGRFYEPPTYGARQVASGTALAIGTLVPDVPLHGLPTAPTEISTATTAPARLAQLLRTAPTVLLIPDPHHDLAAVVRQAVTLDQCGHRTVVLTRGPEHHPAGHLPPRMLHLAADARWWPHVPLVGGLAVLVRPDRYVHARLPIAADQPWPDLVGWVGHETSLMNGQNNPEHVGVTAR